MVEAIGFCCPSIMGEDYGAHTIIRLCHGGNLPDSLRVIGVGADKDREIRCRPAGEARAQHSAYDIGFVPRRYEYRDSAGSVGGGKAGPRHPRMAGIDKNPPPCRAAQKGKIKQKIIQPADQQAEKRKQQQLIMQCSDNIRNAIQQSQACPLCMEYCFFDCGPRFAFRRDIGCERLLKLG